MMGSMPGGGLGGFGGLPGAAPGAGPPGSGVPLQSGFWTDNGRAAQARDFPAMLRMMADAQGPAPVANPEETYAVQIQQLVDMVRRCAFDAAAHCSTASSFCQSHEWRTEREAAQSGTQHNE